LLFVEMSDFRGHNFGAGPAVLPLAVLLEAQQGLVNYKGSGRSVMELSHRSSLFEEILQNAESQLRSLMNIPSNYRVLFLQGGGTGQFAAIPLNLLGDNAKERTADYIITGTWSKKAAEEAQKYCHVNIVCSSESTNFTSIPEKSQWKFSPDSAYVYYCANETIHGVEFAEEPTVPNGAIVVCDMSSNFLSKKVDVSKYGLIFAGAQKNSGIAGLTVVIVRDDLLGKEHSMTPTILSYKVFSENKSLYNTPGTWSIYIAGLVYNWLMQLGRITAIEKLNAEKAEKVYRVIEEFNTFYRCPVDKSCRSRMNVPVRLPTVQLERQFIAQALDRHLFELQGHRTVGGVRISLFNAIPMESVDILISFMKQFAANNK